MIDTFHINNLKCYGKLSLPLAPLTVLSGFNAGGKSTTTQGALLFAQALRANGRTPWIGLNGPLVQLGTAGEIVNGGHGLPREIGLGFEGKQSRVIWWLDPADRGAPALRISSIEITDLTGSHSVPLEADTALDDFLPTGRGTTDLFALTSALRNLCFIGALRTANQEVFPSPESGDPIYGDVGARGEFAPWWLNRLSEEEVEKARRSTNDAAPTLRRQVCAWGGELFPGFEVTAQGLERTGLIQLQLRNSITKDWHRPSNVGYGLSYAFPILVAGLVLRSGQMLVIDSPEAHLHPRAQSRMGRFLASIAGGGVRIIVETHSDHVLNGIRVAIKDKIIKPEDTAIYFFSSSSRVGQAAHEEFAQFVEPSVLRADVDINGRISNWPEGFFDQIENDLALL